MENEIKKIVIDMAKDVVANVIIDVIDEVKERSNSLVDITEIYKKPDEEFLCDKDDSVLRRSSSNHKSPIIDTILSIVPHIMDLRRKSYTSTTINLLSPRNINNTLDTNIEYSIENNINEIINDVIIKPIIDEVFDFIEDEIVEPIIKLYKAPLKRYDKNGFFPSHYETFTKWVEHKDIIDNHNLNFVDAREIYNYAYFPDDD